ncbi:hypothetical protein F9L16_23505 [Agarivorans sp. B2Z047]|uniref:hypothetical protein n=1 Tax=Agarivorans sp. B2Z047 TaxID=2652721 RepID=UPI00128CA850|nr:hypothetical protein [Agarivorans sp. B2Z047]MPW31924.1 hypothetical protein [Agarivorans sp. B2Z047]UQN41894.1 hypothetical protein LQZ07_19260 [Agarivorans sp. B2Z047]
MKVLDVLTKVGAGILSSNPIGAAALTVVNAFLPKDKKLPENATGEQAQRAIDSMPPELQSQISLAEINLQVEEERGRTERYKAMCESDGQETRAKIVNKAMNALIAMAAAFVLSLGFITYKHGPAAILEYGIELGALFITLTGTFAYVVRAYFGDLKRETMSRHSTIDDKPRQKTMIESLLNK